MRTWPLQHVPKPEARAAILSLSAGLLLMGIKFLAYALTGSTAIFSDAIEGIVNVAASGFAMYALALAHRPADARHPYGHGKIEFISASFEGGMILLAALVIFARAIEDIVTGPELHEIDRGLLLMVLTVLGNGALGIYLIRRGRKYGSAALEADGKHLLSDAITSISVLIGLTAVRLTGWQVLDPIVALLVAMYIGWFGIHLLRTSGAGLMDAQDTADAALLERILNSHIGSAAVEPRICGFHKLRHRHSGRYHWVDFHIMVPRSWNVDHGHQVASAIEYEIELALGEGDATAHVEPCPQDGCDCGNTIATAAS